MKICIRCVMDETDPALNFDNLGVCNYCRDYPQFKEKNVFSGSEGQNRFIQTLERMKSHGRGQDYDCILGMSGGVDSSYLAYLAGKYKLRPLIVHLDNGWNSEIAVKNIKNIVKRFNFDLHTHVIDWQEFRDLQRAFFKANVIDIEALTDHAIFATILKESYARNIKFSLSGRNVSSEYIMPNRWTHRKSDAVNICKIHKKFGERPLKTFPFLGTVKQLFYKRVLRFESVELLNMVDYNRQQAKAELMAEVGWKDYGAKHHESVFTKFYQNHILPEKFNVDKRKAHFSSLICAGQMTRDQAIELLKEPLYDPNELVRDREYVLKKLGFSQDFFAEYLKTPEVAHQSYGSDERQLQMALGAWNFLKKLNISRDVGQSHSIQSPNL